MEKLDDKAIQELIESQLNGTHITEPFKDSKEEELYRILFKELSDDSFVVSKKNLGEVVVEELQMQQDRKDALYYNLAILAMIFMAIFLSYLAIILVNPRLLNTIILAFKKNEDTVLFVFGVVGMIQISDWLFSNLKLKKAI